MVIKNANAKMEKNELFAVFDEPPGESAVSGESERFSGNGPGEVAGGDQAALFEGAADRGVDAGNHPAVHAVFGDGADLLLRNVAV